MLKNLIPAICALIATIVLASLLAKKAGDGISQNDLEAAPAEKLPNACRRLRPLDCHCAPRAASAR